MYPNRAEQYGDGQARSRYELIDFPDSNPYPPIEAALPDRAAMPLRCAKNMKLLFATLFAAMTLHCASEEQGDAITISPMLGAGFGKIIEIEGRIVDDQDTRLRAHLGKKLIEVQRVGTHALPKPAVIEVLVFGWTDIRIPERGTVVRFRGYETGGFTGFPNEAFEDVPSVATTAHHFQSQFQVTKLLNQTKAQQGVTPQSATRSVSDSEGCDNPKPESEPRPR
jgi:hypothetical protein